MDPLERPADPQAAAPEPPWWPDDDATTQPTRVRWLAALAVVPWIAVAALLVRPTSSPGPSDTAMTSTAVGEIAPSAAPTPTRIVTPTPDAAPAAVEVTEFRSGARLTPDVGDAVTVAVIAVRSWFTGPGPKLVRNDLALAGEQPGYVEHLWVEAVDRPWRGHVVVTLGVLVLETADGRLTPVARRVAVPVHLDAAGARVADAPYLLPDPVVDDEAVPWTPIDDPDALAAALDALLDAGYPVVDVLGLERSEGWPWAATFTTAGPDGGATTRRVWLRAHLGGFVVAGWLPPSDLPSTTASARQEVAP